MGIEQVEIYSDTTNCAVMRHPGRRFPGALVQGDSLYILCASADRACAAIWAEDPGRAFDEMNRLRNSLWERLIHYKQILDEHEIPLPFVEIPPT